MPSPAAAEACDRVCKLVLYEPAWRDVVDATTLARLEEFARALDWDGLAITFFAILFGHGSNSLKPDLRRRARPDVGMAG
jgi:hypothetical protein